MWMRFYKFSEYNYVNEIYICYIVSTYIYMDKIDVYYIFTNILQSCHNSVMVYS